MGMFVFKMFEPGLVCRGYQFHEGSNTCDHATCVREGFHAAENPLDCLSYYPDFDKSECWLCYADGDIHEDGTDSKISCTSLEILRRLDKFEFVYEAMRYVQTHPKRPINDLVRLEKGEADSNGFVIVMGENPIAKGNRNGDILAWIKQDKNKKIVKLGMTVCYAHPKTPSFHVKGKWYDDDGNEVTEPCE